MTPLRQRFIEDLQLRNRSPKTIKVYVHHLKEYACHFHLSPDQLGLDHAHRYILYLLNDKKASWSSYNQAVSALRFFYQVTCPVQGVVIRLPYGKRPRKLPTVRSAQEVARFLDAVRGRVVRMVLRTAYAAGLRLNEALQTLLEVAANPRHLGARVEVLAVLHTWGQQLEHHPHGHCVVPGGGLACDQNGVVEEPWRWQSCRPTFFLPVKVLGQVFRGKYLAGLRRAYQHGELPFAGSTAELADAAAFAAFVQRLYATDWVVHSKEPFGGPEQVLALAAGAEDACPWCGGCGWETVWQQERPRGPDADAGSGKGYDSS